MPRGFHFLKTKAAEVLTGLQRDVYENPFRFAEHAASSTRQAPRVHVQASRTGAIKLLGFLDAHQRLELLLASEVRSSHACGACALLKDQARDRLILDVRPANALEEPALNEYTRTLGAPSHAADDFSWGRPQALLLLFLHFGGACQSQLHETSIGPSGRGAPLLLFRTIVETQDGLSLFGYDGYGEPKFF